MYALRFTVAGALLSLFLATATAGEAQGRACERFLSANDLHIDIREEILTFLIVNTTDNCSVVFSDTLKTEPGQEHEWPTALDIRVESLTGNVLNRISGMEDWFGVLADANEILVVDFTLKKLRAGEVRKKRWAIGSLLRALSRYLIADSRKDLPWNSTVVVQVRATVFIDEQFAAQKYSGVPRHVVVETPKFLLTLPGAADRFRVLER
jgi:hypothetical protein